MKVSNRIDANEIDWSKFKFMVFDIPRGVEGSYSDRYRKIGNLIILIFIPLKITKNI